MLHKSYEYECCFVVGDYCNLYEETCDKVIEFIRLVGKVNRVDRIGRKRLAYTIKENEYGYFYNINFTVEPEYIGELERRLRNNQYILKFVTIRTEE